MKTLEALRKLQLETEAEVFLVGGFVRDLLRRKPSVDLDVVVRLVTIKSVEHFLSKLGKVKRVTLSDKGNELVITNLLFIAEGDTIEAQIQLPKRGSSGISDVDNTLKQDVRCRDFTINGMYLPIDYKSSNDIIDFVDGREDITNRRIIPINNPTRCIKESPIRMMRAVSLASRTGYSIDKKLASAIKSNAKRLATLPVENVREEFNKILLSRRPSAYLRILNKLRLLSVFFPELTTCIGVKQNGDHHKYDVFSHCIYACDNADQDLVLRLAALLHDVGKAEAYEVINKKITFHKHELYSESAAHFLLGRLGYSNAITKKVKDLVRYHMYHYISDAHFCISESCTWSKHIDPMTDTHEEATECPICKSELGFRSGWSDAAVRRFIRNFKLDDGYINRLDSFPLFRIRVADRLGSGYKNIPITERQKDFQKRIVKLYEESKALRIKDLDLTGEDLKKMFGLKQSPLIGEALNHLLNKVLENPTLNNKKELMLEATSFLYGKRF